MKATPSQPECHGKKRYTKNEVYRARKYVGKARDKDMRIYECPDCFGYHITKKGTYE